MRALSLVCIAALAAACGRGKSSTSSNAAALISAQLSQDGVECAPPHPEKDEIESELPASGKACANHKVGDVCFFHAGEMTVIGFCTADSSSALVCAPRPPAEFVAACAAPKGAGSDCTVGTFSGKCAALFPGGPVACLPVPPAPPPAPPPVAACAGLKADADCSFKVGDKTITGECEPAEHGLLVCIPGPPAPIEVCDTAKPGASCSFTVGTATVNGFCRAVTEAGLLACVPHEPPEPEPFVTACANHKAGDSCTVTDEGKTFTGVCHQLPSGVTVCLPPPPPPPQVALDACAKLTKGATCSFPWEDETVSGACELMPDGKTLVCSPTCREE